MNNSIEVKLHFISTADGGRKTPVASGYRTNCILPDGSSWTIQLQFDGIINPGEVKQAYGTFLCSEPYEIIKDNMIFELREGLKKVADGEIICK